MDKPQTRDEHSKNIEGYNAAIKAIRRATFSGEDAESIAALLKFLDMNLQVAQEAFDKSCAPVVEFGKEVVH